MCLFWISLTTWYDGQEKNRELVHFNLIRFIVKIFTSLFTLSKFKEQGKNNEQIIHRLLVANNFCFLQSE